MPEEVAPLKILSLTETQRDALTPTEPMLVFNSTRSALQSYIDGGWVSLLIGRRNAIADAAYTVGTTDAFVASTYGYSSITANRIFTLCAANAVPAGFRLRVEDASGSCKSPGPTGTGIEIQVKPAGTDTVEGVAAATNFEVIRDPRGSVELESDGSSNWSIVAVTPHTRCELFVVAGTYTAGWRKPLTAVKVFVRAIGGGGGGGSGSHNVVNSTSGGGGGGAGGGVSEAHLGAAALGTTIDVVVGAGGAGGSSPAGTTGNGAVGTGGGFSYVSSATGVGHYPCVASGGGGGGAGLNAGAAVGGVITNGNTLPNAAPYSSGGAGSNSSPAAAGVDGAAYFMGPGGGGGGGGGTSGTILQSGAGGVGSYGTESGAAGIPGGVAGGNQGTSVETVWAGSPAGALGGSGGSGGSGRQANAGANGIDGATGGKYGAGGGGGSNGVGASGSFHSGAGGAGADGAVEITTYR